MENVSLAIRQVGNKFVGSDIYSASAPLRQPLHLAAKWRTPIPSPR